MDTEYVARPTETLTFYLTLAGILFGALGVLTRRHRTRRAGGGLLLAVGAAGIGLAWDDWTRRVGRHMSLTALKHPVPLNDWEKRAIRVHVGQLVAGVVLLW